MVQIDRTSVGEDQKRKRISIKTVGGSRFDFEAEGNLVENIPKSVRFFRVETAHGSKYFNIDNIVSITETVVEE